MNNRKTPRIRFRGFTDDWEQRKLGEIGKAHSGVGFPDAEQGGRTGVPFFKVSDMNLDVNENEMTISNNYVTAEQIANHRWSPITELPAIFFAKVGAAVLLNRKRLCRFPFLLDNNTMSYSLSPTKWDADFAKALFGTVDLTSLVQVGALPSYNAGDVESMEKYLPSLLEQEQIGVFFKHFDHLITLHQRKLEKLKIVKKAMLENCFPKNGEKVPKFRFSGFTGDWEQRKLGEMIKEVTRTDESSEAPVMMITANDGFINQSERYSTDNAGQSLKKYILLHKGELAYNHGASKLRPYGSCFALTTEKNARIPFVYHCFSTDTENPEFLSLVLNGKMVEWQLRKIVSSGARMDGLLNISYEEYTSIPIMMPERGEQNKIANFFRGLDHLITLHQRKLEKLKIIKKSFLEKMFV